MCDDVGPPVYPRDSATNRDKQRKKTWNQNSSWPSFSPFRAAEPCCRKDLKNLTLAIVSWGIPSMQPPKSCCILAEQGLEVCVGHAINGFQQVHIVRQESLGVHTHAHVQCRNSEFMCDSLALSLWKDQISTSQPPPCVQVRPLDVVWLALAVLAALVVLLCTQQLGLHVDGSSGGRAA